MKYVEVGAISQSDVFDFESTSFNMAIFFIPRDWADADYESVAKFEEYVSLKAYQYNWTIENSVFIETKTELKTRRCIEDDYDKFFNIEDQKKFFWPLRTCLNDPADYKIQGSFENLQGGQTLTWQLDKCTGFDYCKEDEEIEEFLRTYMMVFDYNDQDYNLDKYGD